MLTNTPITPDEFRRRMKEIKENGDQEEAHIEADQLMCSLLDTLGYGRGVATFRGMYKWYA